MGMNMSKLKPLATHLENLHFDAFQLRSMSCHVRSATKLPIFLAALRPNSPAKL